MLCPGHQLLFEVAHIFIQLRYIIIRDALLEKELDRDRTQFQFSHMLKLGGVYKLLLRFYGCLTRDCEKLLEQRNCCAFMESVCIAGLELL